MPPDASSPTPDLAAAWPQHTPRIYFDPVSTNAAEILCELAVDLVDSPFEADLLWIRKDPDDWYAGLEAFQALNHIPHEGAMVRKADLAEKLHAYGAAQAPDAFSHRDFFPETYRLNDPHEAAAFMAQLPHVDSPENPWILKPSNLSRGRGVKIVWRFDALRKELRKHGEITFRYEGDTYEYVIQRYIKDVLLLDGKKSELRIYWLIASLDPLLVLMYPEGTARLTLEPYKLDDFSNPLIHITNAYQQKKHGGERPDAELKWDFARLQAYLSKEKGAPENFVSEVLPRRLMGSLEYVVRACIDSLRQTPPSGFFFGVYGADVILDQQLTPWLTEIQKGPGLSYDDSVKRRVLPAMLQGAVSIVLEILAKKREGKPLTPLSSTHGFEWVIGGH